MSDYQSNEQISSDNNTESEAECKIQGVRTTRNKGGFTPGTVFKGLLTKNAQLLSNEVVKIPVGTSGNHYLSLKIRDVLIEECKAQWVYIFSKYRSGGKKTFTTTTNKKEARSRIAGSQNTDKQKAARSVNVQKAIAKIKDLSERAKILGIKPKELREREKLEKLHAVDIKPKKKIPVNKTKEMLKQWINEVNTQEAKKTM